MQEKLRAMICLFFFSTNGTLVERHVVIYRVFFTKVQRMRTLLTRWTIFGVLFWTQNLNGHCWAPGEPPAGDPVGDMPGPASPWSSRKNFGFAEKTTFASKSGLTSSCAEPKQYHQMKNNNKSAVKFGFFPTCCCLASSSCFLPKVSQRDWCIGTYSLEIEPPSSAILLWMTLW